MEGGWGRFLVLELMDEFNNIIISHNRKLLNDESKTALYCMAALKLCGDTTMNGLWP